MKKILVLEDDEVRNIWFRKYLKGCEIDFATKPKIAIDYLMVNSYDEIYLDHDLEPEHYRQDTSCNTTTGLAVAEWLRDNPESNKEATIIIHSRNVGGADRMKKAIIERQCVLTPVDILSKGEAY